MKLKSPGLKPALVRLPHQFNSDRLQREVARLSDADWNNDPEGSPGLRVAPLVSVGGAANNDLAISGPMRETSALTRSPYLRQVLAAFERPVSRTHLLGVGPNAALPSRQDSGYYWYRRARIHVPVLTNPAVIFECGNSSAHMRAGETWHLDNRQAHSLINGSESPCVHLVIDLKTSPAVSQASPIEPYCFEVLTAEEFTTLAGCIREGAPDHAQKKVNAALTAASECWQEVYLRSGNSARAEAEYYLVIERLRRELAEVELEGEARWALDIILSVLRTDDGLRRQGRRGSVSGQPVVAWNAEARYRANDRNASVPSPRIAAVVKAFHEPRTIEEAHEAANHVLRREQFAVASRDLHRIGLLEQDLSETILRDPVFIVSTPRSGSTMLFDALRKSEDLWTIGHESHALLEQGTGLHPEEREWSSNRLTADDCSPKLKSLLTHRYARELRNIQDVYLTTLTMEERQTGFRLLDKTPKNALRIPFLRGIFPDARFVYLYRDPGPNISSMIEGWRSGQFITYRRLPEWPYWPWSFLLAPGWRQLRGSPPAEIAAFQWSSANAHIIGDLAALPACSWIAISYENLVCNPRQALQALFRFLNCSWGQAAEEYARCSLPLSPTTLGAPHPDKWRKHEHIIRPLLPELNAILTRAKEMEA